MIDKVLVYCWFGGNPKPRLIQNCLDSWKKIIPEYPLIEINESNFDIESYRYVKQAYRQKKWAFCSDVARFDWLNKNSGITIDADVECIKPFPEDMLNNRAFTSKESAGRWISAVIASESNHPWVERILRYYIKHDFIYDPSKICNTTIIDEINHRLYERIQGNVIYLRDQVAIYPSEYLEAKDWSTGKKNVTHNTITCHNYTASWVK